MRALAIALVLVAGVAEANTALSIRPVPREAVAREPVAATTSGSFAPVRSLRPVARGRLAPKARSARAPAPQADAKPRKNTFGQQLRAAFKPKPSTPRGSARVAKGLQGAVCGDPLIRGEKITSIPAKLPGCGLSHGVKVTEVAGVALTQHARIDCNTARALKSWVEKGVKPAVGKRGGGVKSLQVVAHYNCRTRNNKRGGRISEHGKGRAVDIAAINLKDGSQMTVLKGWRSKKNGPALRQMHKAACGPFGTVLGPKADRYHQDHFHLDTARYRSGPYCR